MRSFWNKYVHLKILKEKVSRKNVNENYIIALFMCWDTFRFTNTNIPTITTLLNKDTIYDFNAVILVFLYHFALENSAFAYSLNYLTVFRLWSSIWDKHMKINSIMFTIHSKPLYIFWMWVDSLNSNVCEKIMMWKVF